MALTGLIIVGSAIVLYSLFLDGVWFNRPIDIQNIESLETDKKFYHLGDQVKVHVKFCKYRNLPVHLQWNLIDSYMIPFPPKVVSGGGLPIGCHDIWTDVEKIPDIADDEQARFEAILYYKVNSLREVALSMKTQTFTIIK